MKTFVHSFNQFSLNEMAIRPRKEMHRPEKIEIDLNGPDGNAFALIALAKRLYAKKYPDQVEGFTTSRLALNKIDPSVKLPSPQEVFIDRMTSGDYENLIKVFDEEFGDVVTLYR